MCKDSSRRRVRTPSAATRAFALLLVICLAECATGSCLSYGHSCWGAHGKRSGRPPITAPDWFLMKMFRHLDANADLNRGRSAVTSNDDVNAIYQVDAPDDSSTVEKLGVENDAVPIELSINRDPEAKPMLDDEMLSKMKFWQIMKEASEEK